MRRHTLSAFFVTILMNSGVLQAEDLSVRIERGQTLSALAQTYYGSGALWQRICDANRPQLRSCGRLLIGQVLVIPGVPAPQNSAQPETAPAPETAAAVSAPTPNTPQPVVLPETLARHGGTPEVEAGWFLRAEQNGLIITRTVTGNTPEGLHYADYRVQGVATSNFVDSFYRMEMSRIPAGRGDRFKAQVSLHRLSEAEGARYLSLVIATERDNRFVVSTRSPNALIAQVPQQFEVMHQVEDINATSVRTTIVLSGMTRGEQVDVSFRVADLRVELVD